MKAIHLTKTGHASKSFEIKEVDIPTPSENEVCIKVNSFGINFADVLARQGIYQEAPPLPSILGYDVAGTVHSVGSGVKNYEPGQRVTALTKFGGYAEYACTMQEGVSPIADSLDYGTATALATQACTAYYCMEECATLRAGDRVLIQAAAGGVGSIMVQIAKDKGCIVFGTASSAKQSYLKELGVDYPIDYTQMDFVQEVQKELSDYSGVDFVFDSIGGKTFKKAYKLLTPTGKIIFIGAASQLKNGKSSLITTLALATGFGIFSPIQLVMASKGIIGVNMMRVADHRPHIFKHCLDEVVSLWEQGVIKPLVGKTFAANQIADAHHYIESRQSMGKVVCEW